METKEKDRKTEGKKQREANFLRQPSINENFADVPFKREKAQTWTIMRGRLLMNWEFQHKLHPFESNAFLLSVECVSQHAILKAICHTAKPTACLHFRHS